MLWQQLLLAGRRRWATNSHRWCPEIPTADVTAFVFEIPSGVRQDITDRRTLLVLSGPLYAAGFAVWMVGYAGFAIGFVLWALSGALMSGTFEALLYDELAARDSTDDYAGLLGRANSAATAGSVAAIAAAAPLFAWGGYAAVGWTSVAVALVHGALAWALPAAPKSESADATKEGNGRGNRNAPFVARYIATLRTGVSEATTHPQVRHLVVIVAVLYGLTAYDEYFPSVAREAGAMSVDVPLLVTLTVAGQFVGSALAGRTARMSRRRSRSPSRCRALIAGGALARHPAGFVAIAIGYGLNENVAVVSEAKLQDSINGRPAPRSRQCRGCPPRWSPCHLRHRRCRVVVALDVGDAGDRRGADAPRGGGGEALVASTACPGAAGHARVRRGMNGTRLPIRRRWARTEYRQVGLSATLFAPPMTLRSAGCRNRRHESLKSSGVYSLGSTRTSQLPELSRMTASTP